MFSQSREIAQIPSGQTVVGSCIPRRCKFPRVGNRRCKSLQLKKLILEGTSEFHALSALYWFIISVHCGCIIFAYSSLVEYSGEVPCHCQLSSSNVGPGASSKSASRLENCCISMSLHTPSHSHHQFHKCV